MIQPKYQIGDEVYAVELSTSGHKEPCPDCLGERHWLARLPNGEELKMECPTCRSGFDGATGTVPAIAVSGRVVSMTIGSVRTDSASKDRPVEYMCVETGVGSGRIWDEQDLYPEECCAAKVLPTLIAEREQQLWETRACNFKVKRQDAGRMVAHYRAQIRSAKKDIAQAERGLEREARPAGEGR
jgi:hypothetical protein